MEQASCHIEHGLFAVVFCLKWSDLTTL